MIYESSFWKDDLLKQARSVRSRTTQKRWREDSFSRLEQTIMLGFYSIRKLIEAKKLSDSIGNEELNITAYPWKGKPVTRTNCDDLDRLYDLDHPKEVVKDLIFLCHQIVHSYVFQASFDLSGNLDGVFVSSERERSKSLYHIRVGQIISLFEQIGQDYPSRITWTFNSEAQDYEVTSLE
jgi:hypothetical protein